MSNNTIETTVIQIPDCLKEMKLIPLQEYSKIPKNKWGTNEELIFDGSENSYGIDTGRSNLVVIDCDTKGAENGINNFYAQCTANDYEPNTFTVETPNEGLHFYYITKNKNIKTSAGTVFGPGIDVRAQGGYVVGPGSLVKNNNGEPILYNAWDDTCEIEEIPKWIEEKIINSQKKEKTTKTAKTTKNTIISHEKNDSKNTSNEEEERNNALVWALDKMSSASEGTRNSTLNSTAYFMGCKRVEYETAEQLINIAVQNGLNLEEATTTFNSGYEAGLQEEKISYSVMVKEFNTKNGITFKDDPKDPEFY